ncbi:MAG: hypothetical protein KJ697_02940 [Nanoarchaeota archaeon]|nr:hypothetical protein [Nanoarchaeota archaeon]MBU4072451.1 hypothetical protein [Candidatus Thermoplasmatota archaeon]MBU4124422.1 hypothetical protein [Nanoarchaeota archaeon]
MSELNKSYGSFNLKEIGEILLTDAFVTNLLPDSKYRELKLDKGEAENIYKSLTEGVVPKDLIERIKKKRIEQNPGGA